MRFSRIARPLILALLLASCGSGGDSSTTSTPTSSAAPTNATPVPLAAAASVPSAMDTSTNTGSPAPVDPTTYAATNAQAVVSDVAAVLIEIVPASGPAGIAYPLQATVRGRGFMATANSVVFGPITIANLPSTDGTQITFAVPKLLQSSGGPQPLVFPAGDYAVTVTTTSGTSNALTFTLTRSP